MATRTRPRFRFIPPKREDASDRPRTTREQLITIGLLIIPGAIIYTLFLIMPIAQAANYSLYDWNGLGPLADYVGFGNYERAFGHSVFQTAIGNSLIITVLSLVIQLPLAMP